MKVPDICSHCKIQIGDSNMEVKKGYWIERTELDYDSEDDDRIEDQIWECSSCHTLFRLRWKLESFVELVEKKEDS